MKKFFPLLIIPFTVCADTCTLYQEGGGEWRIVCEGNGIVTRYEDVTNEVYVIANCEQLKSSLLSSAEYIEEQATLNQQEASQASRAAADLQIGIDSSNIWMSDIYTNSWYLLVDGANDSWQYAGRLKAAAQNLQNTIDTINCGSCPPSGEGGGGSGGGACCDVDFTQIIDRLIVAEQQRAAISNQIARISHYLGVVTNQIAYNNFLLEHGFHDVTNTLDNIVYQLVLNRTSPIPILNQQLQINQLRDPNSTPTRHVLSPTSLDPSATHSGYLAVYARGFSWLSSALTTLVNYQYPFFYHSVPAITNELANFHLDFSRDFSAYSDETTNFFSFFRGEIGVQGVLEDWTSEELDGTYYDFLTNHYLAVVRGDSLSGNQSSKTNWFSRIETLLAALVFDGSAEINTVDSSKGEDERAELSSSYLSANQTASNFSQDFNTASQGIVDLYRSYFTTFDNAAMPSHVVLMKLSSDDSEDIEIAFQSDSLSILVEACRVVTTLCWSSVGIFLLYKFLVWSARCVIVACQFIYRAISSVFRS